MSTSSSAAAASGQGTPLLERDQELSRIRHALEEATAGSGQLVVIEGATGIGKSRLLRESARLAEDQGMEVLHGRSGELEREYSFGLVLRLLEARLARASEDERRRLLRGRASLAGPLLMVSGDDERQAATSDEFGLVHGLYWCIVNLSEEAPVALLVDDVHWADDLSLRFLIYLAERLEDLPVALIATIRRGDVGAESDLVRHLATAAAASPVRPAELTVAAVGDLLARADLPAAANEEFVRATWKATRGNPFLVSELIAAIRTEGTPSVAVDPSQIAPHTVARRIVLRLSQMGEEALELARACAVLGDDCPMSWAARLARLDLAAAVSAAERLVAAQILTGADRLSFAHPMIRSAVYGELPPGEGPHAHAAAAALLHGEGAPADEVARHLLAGTPTSELWARAALHEGARAAARKGAPATAVRYLRRAVELCPPGERSGEMLVDLGMVEAAAGETTSLARLEEALGMIEEPGEQARALYALGQTLYRYGRHDDAAVTFRRGAELFKHDRELTLQFEGAFMCAAWFVEALHREAMEHLDATADDLIPGRPTTAAERVLLAVRAFHRAMAVPPAAEAIALLREALAGGALLREQTSDSMAVALAIYALMCAGATEEAQHAADDVLADARRRGSALAFAEAAQLRAYISYRRGRITDAAADAHAAIEGMQQRGWLEFGPLPGAILSQCLIERGELDEAQSVLESAEQRLSGPSRGLNAWFHWARGRLRLARLDAAGALEDFLAAGELFEAYGLINPVIPWRSLAGLAAHALGDRDQALDLIGQEIALAREFAIPAELGAALHARAVVEGDPQGTQTLEEALAVLEDSDQPLVLARVLLDLGRGYRRAGERVASREPLRRALDLAHRLGATALEQQARGELLASGARPRRAAATGVDALTPSERRIAELAANGVSNRQIAELLFLTKNTVEWHLKHVYRKLDIGSREELRHWLQEDTAETAA